jgi:hypothetical protein
MLTPRNSCCRVPLLSMPVINNHTETINTHTWDVNVPAHATNTVEYPRLVTIHGHVKYYIILAFPLIRVEPLLTPQLITTIS